MALSKLAVRRLTKLADYMDSLPKSANKHFDMGQYWEHRGQHKEKHFSGAPQSKRDLLTCGTTACAAGWAATMPYFKNLGLALYSNNGASIKNMTEVFDITNGQWGAVFGDWNAGLRTPKQWAKHCRKFIRENRK